MDGGHGVDRLDLDDHSVSDQEIDAVARRYEQPLVLEIQADLGGNGHIAKAELVDQAPPIGALEKTRAQMPMDLNGRSNDDLGESLVMQCHLCASSVFSVAPWWMAVAQRHAGCPVPAPQQ